MWKWQVKAKNGHFFGNTNSGDQNFLNPFIIHIDTSHYLVLKKIGVTSSAPFALILTNAPVKPVVFLHSELNDPVEYFPRILSKLWQEKIVKHFHTSSLFRGILFLPGHFPWTISIQLL